MVFSVQEMEIIKAFPGPLSRFAVTIELIHKIVFCILLLIFTTYKFAISLSEIFRYNHELSIKLT